MKIGLRILLGYFLIVALAALLVGKVFVEQIKPGVRQAMEDTLGDTANLLAALAADELQAGRMNDGDFARRLRELSAREIKADIWGFSKQRVDSRVYVTDARGIVVFDSSGRDVGADYSRWNDVYLTLRGQYGARSTRADPDDEASTVMHVAAPVRDDAGALIGVLTVAKPNQVMAPFIARSQQVVLRWGLVLMGAALLIGLLAAWWLSAQLGRLRRYAMAVSAGERASLPASAGEFNELGHALENMRQQLEGKQYVEQYVHALTHELKSPLAAIRGAAELLESPLPEADRRRFVQTIASQGERLAQMIDKLLALAAVEHRQRLEDPAPVDIGALLQELAGELAAPLQAAAVQLQLPAPMPQAWIDGDTFLLRQSLRNLLDNAIAFAPAGSSIAVSVHREHDQLRIDVADRGPGVPDYAQPRVFERFYSLARPEGGSRGSGLGLCFVAEAAQLHGGRAALANRDGGGAVASLWLPLPAGSATGARRTGATSS